MFAAPTTRALSGHCRMGMAAISGELGDGFGLNKQHQTWRPESP